MAVDMTATYIIWGLIWISSWVCLLEVVRDGTFEITDEYGMFLRVLAWVAVLTLAPLWAVFYLYIWLTRFNGH